VAGKLWRAHEPQMQNFSLWVIDPSLVPSYGTQGGCKLFCYQSSTLGSGNRIIKKYL